MNARLGVSLVAVSVALLAAAWAAVYAGRVA